MAGNRFASMAKIWMRCLSLFSALYSKALPPPSSLTHAFPAESAALSLQHARSAERSAMISSEARQAEGSSLEAARMRSALGCGDHSALWVSGRLGA